ncbi:SDR family NAD(P)-dependent oxidoreductase [Psychromarinibacter sp. C21-152]|uniref:SDR family NAD(P)-dependent oxidoreductase n=1 Tax=Psychromarinibacter sediminicola TaxID=3033385 RepID=A0AAE3T8Q3_9RHOB|nr:SDR family NAD(P)-dependent oxidoreductase [Psychromarinibacter sediminicola]MDF0600279.1 SDR family NAD(P)-dependent oxidoreductase [Psychromarinibacter sediminicola]
MLQGKAAIITGASRGIGRAAAVALAKAGARVLVHGTNADLLEPLAEEIGGLWLAGDVADPATAAAAVARAEARFGGVDILVNNAGINTRSATLDMTLDDWQRVIDVNLTGTLHFCRAVLPGMIAQGAGRIVNVSSAASKTPHRNAAPAYGASKAGVNYLTLHLAQEMAPHGIHVNAVCPGPVESDMTAQWDDDYRAKVLQRVPLGRLGTAEQVAEAVLFLAGPGADFVTGELLDVNGGTVMD